MILSLILSKIRHGTLVTDAIIASLLSTDLTTMILPKDLFPSLIPVALSFNKTANAWNGFNYNIYTHLSIFD